MVEPVFAKPEKDKSDGKAAGRTPKPFRPLESRDPYAGIMDLQHMAGNRVVSQLLEADRNGVPPIVREVLQSGNGQPLDPATRADMEERFGEDFSHVRVHTDAKAARSAASIGARAYTAGTDLVFAVGEYAPHSQSGRHLLAHELAHVVQQLSVKAPASLTRLSIGEPNTQAESAAEQASNAAWQPVRSRLGLAGQLAAQAHVDALQVQRQPFSTAPDAVTKLEQIRRAANQLAYQLEAVKARRDEQEKINRDQWAVSWFSEQIGSAAGAFQGKGLRRLNIPEKTIWDTSERLLKEVRHWLATGDVMRAAHTLQNLADEFTKADTELNEYLAGVIGGAEISTTSLKAAAAAGAIAAAIATGGVAAGAGLTVLGTSAAVGVGAGTYGLVQETAAQTGEMFAGSRQAGDFDRAVLIRGGKDAVNGFVGAFTGGVFTKYAARYFGRIAISRMSKDQIANLAERLGVDAVDLTPQVFLGKGQQFLIEFFAGGVATAPITSAVEVTLNNLTGQPSQESFVKTVVDNAIQEGLLQLFLGFLTHGKVKPGRGGKPVSLPEAPAKMPLQSAQERIAEVQAQTKSSFTPPKEPIARTEALPEAPAEMPLQSHQEWIAEVQAQTKSSFTSPKEPTAYSESLPEAPAATSFQTSQEASQQWTALKQLEAGTPKPGLGQPEIEPATAGDFRKTRSKKGVKSTSRKAELEQTGPAAKKRVAAGTMIESGVVEKTAYESYNPSGRQRSPGREEQMHDLRAQEDWKAHRKGSDAFRRRTMPSLSKNSLKVDDPDPAFPGETVTAINIDHIFPIRKIRDLPGFAKLDSETAKFEIENMPENLEPVSEKVNKSRGDLSYEEWAKSESGLKADPAYLAQQIAKEKQIMQMIQARIDELLRLQMTKEWKLRLGMPSW